MIKKPIYLLLAMFVVACSNSKDNAPSEQTQNASDVEEIYVDPVKQQLKEAFSAIFQTFSEQDSSFDINKFEDTGSDSLATRALAETRQLKEYYPFFIYNSDSTFAIDLYSYNVLLVKRNGQTIPQEAGPDTEVGLVELKNKTRQRIYFGGSSSAVLDAHWISNIEFVLLTGEFVGEGQFQPTVLKFKTTDHTITHFAYPDTLRLGATEYRGKKLNNL